MIFRLSVPVKRMYTWGFSCLLAVRVEVIDVSVVGALYVPMKRIVSESLSHWDSIEALYRWNRIPVVSWNMIDSHFYQIVVKSDPTLLAVGSIFWSITYPSARRGMYTWGCSCTSASTIKTM